jgi:hypothetical protein
MPMDMSVPMKSQLTRINCQMFSKSLVSFYNKRGNCKNAPYAGLDKTRPEGGVAHAEKVVAEGAGDGEACSRQAQFCIAAREERISVVTGPAWAVEEFRADGQIVIYRPGRLAVDFHEALIELGLSVSRPASRRSAPAIYSPRNH